MAKSSEARIRANNKYNAKAYDRILYSVPKGTRASIDKAADAAGQSVSAYTAQAVRERMEREAGASNN